LLQLRKLTRAAPGRDFSRRTRYRVSPDSLLIERGAYIPLNSPVFISMPAATSRSQFALFRAALDVLGKAKEGVVTPGALS